MLIDIIVLILLAWAVFKGMRKGFVVGIFSLLAFIIGLAAAIKLSAVAAKNINENFEVSQRWLPVLAFAVVFIAVILLVNIGAKALEGVLRIVMLGWLNKLGGVILFTLLYLFVFSILLFYAAQLHLLKQNTISSSYAYPYLKPLGPKVIDGLAFILPFFKNMFSELLQFFDNTEAVMPKMGCTNCIIA